MALITKSIKGTLDLLPNESYKRQFVEHTCLEIAQNFGYNTDYIGKYFKKARGIGLKEYLTAQRIKLAKDLLLTTDMSVKQISRELGYGEENLFIKFFTYHEKISPAAFKAKYCNTHINNK